MLLHSQYTTIYTTHKQGDNHDRHKATSIQSIERRRESISSTRYTIWKGNNSRAPQSRSATMQTLIELGQVARPFIIIAMALGTFFALPVLLSLVDTDKDD